MRASSVCGFALWFATDRARRRVQEAKWVAMCSKAPLTFVLSRSGGGAHVMPVCHTAITKCLPPTVVQIHVLKVLVFFTPRLALLVWCKVLGKPLLLPRRPHVCQLVWIFDALPVVSFCKASPSEDELPRLFDLIWRFQDPGLVTILSGRRALQHRPQHWPSREEHRHAEVQCVSVGLRASSCHWLHPRGVYAIQRSAAC